jgi:hypothetical protein
MLVTVQVGSFNSVVTEELLANQLVSLLLFVFLLGVFALFFWLPKKKQQPYTKMNQLQRGDKLTQIKERILAPIKLLQKQLIKNRINDHSERPNQQRYTEAARAIAEADKYLWQGVGQSELSEVLVGLSPESIQAISDRGWKKRGRAEPTNELLIRVLARIAEEKSPQEGKLAIEVLRSVLSVPEDNTSGWISIQNACIKKLDELNALPGVEYNEEQVSEEEPFQLDPIDASEIGPFRNMPSDRANFEAGALWELAHPREHREEEVMQRFKRNYTKWSKSFDARSLSLVLCAYGLVLERLERYCEAVQALRWSCKIYPCRDFTACEVLHKVEEKAAKARAERRKYLFDKQEICEYCDSLITVHERTYIFHGNVTCEECNKKLRERLGHV